MTTTVTATFPNPSALMRAWGAPLSAPRPLAQVETARAPSPVPEGNEPADLRGDGARDRPVGPPPAFDINVLEDLRARAAAQARSESEPHTEEVKAEAGRVGAVFDPRDEAAIGATEPLAGSLDRKV